MRLSQTGNGRFRRDLRSSVMRIMTIAAVALVAAIAVAAPASADDDPPADGSPCQGGDIGNSTTASDGKTVRCVADEQGGFSWIVDTGTVKTIADLQKQGFQVQIIRIGGGPLQHCQVTDVGEPHIDTRTERTGPGDNTTTIVLNKTIPVTLDCRAMS